MCLAIPGRIVELIPDTATGALVDVVGVRRRIDLGLLQDDPPVPGDWVLIHVGFAMSRISAEEAEDQLRMLMLLGEHDAAVTEATGYGLSDEDGGDDGAGDDVSRDDVGGDDVVGDVESPPGARAGGGDRGGAS